MRILLDTHALLWWRADDPRLPRSAERLIMNPRNEVFFSVVSLWEMAIKRGLGKLEFPGSLTEFATGLSTNQGFLFLPLEVSHLERLERLPRHHRDPFDRLLIAQTFELSGVALSNDPAWKRYRVRTRW